MEEGEKEIGVLVLDLDPTSYDPGLSALELLQNHLRMGKRAEERVQTEVRVQRKGGRGDESRMGRQ